MEPISLTLLLSLGSMLLKIGTAWRTDRNYHWHTLAITKAFHNAYAGVLEALHGVEKKLANVEVAKLRSAQMSVTQQA